PPPSRLRLVRSPLSQLEATASIRATGRLTRPLAPLFGANDGLISATTPTTAARIRERTVIAGQGTGLPCIRSSSDRPRDRNRIDSVIPSMFEISGNPRYFQPAATRFGRARKIRVQLASKIASLNHRRLVILPYIHRPRFPATHDPPSALRFALRPGH